VSRIRAVIYDAGETLLEPRPDLDELCRAAARHGVRLTPEQLAPALPDLAHFFHQREQAGRSVWESDQHTRQAWAEYYASAFAAAGVRAPRRELLAVGAALYDWYSHPEQWRLFPDALPALAALRGQGYVQGVISDWGPDLLPILHTLGVTPYLHFVVVSAVVGFAKPSGEIFHHALVRAGVPAEAAVYVGDSYGRDVIGARAAGLRPVLLDRRGLAPPVVDCPVIASLAELPPLLDG
jgi:putative hydrolase of the HAD superfamily